MGSTLSLYTSPLPPPLSLFPIDSLPPYPIISQNRTTCNHMPATRTASSNTGTNIDPVCSSRRSSKREGGEAGIWNIEVAKPQLFDRMPSKVAGFVTGYKLYIRNKLAGITVEAQVQWILSFIQGGLADVWKEKYNGRIGSRRNGI